ncbi:rRNA-processing protein [Thraustotheca clavata]|uniref:rRNA-processing protein n=1 Tax=Thraustotheca clavata TaxID=74557 RepID=A0A1W0A5N2_9STRA|nr:rRNA-processing protein [Thraustotheca clavata]
MRYLRSKHIRKALRQFQFLCGIKPPYKVLLDGNFIAMCIKMNVDIATRVPKFLQTDKCHFIVTQAALEELKLLSSSDTAMMQAWTLAKTFQTVDLKEDNVTNATLNAVGERNDRKYIVATQETELRSALRRVPGVPLIYLNRSVLVFEDMSEATLKISRKEDHIKMSKLNNDEAKQLQTVLDENKPTAKATTIKPRMPKKAKGPNPLAVKKSSKPKKMRTKKKKD